MSCSEHIHSRDDTLVSSHNCVLLNALKRLFDHSIEVVVISLSGDSSSACHKTLATTATSLDANMVDHESDSFTKSLLITLIVSNVTGASVVSSYTEILLIL